MFLVYSGFCQGDEKKVGRKLFILLTISAVLAGGCSKEQVVKSLKKIPIVKDIPKIPLPKIKLPEPKPKLRANSQTVDGELWSLVDEIGKVVVVSFWSTEDKESKEWEPWLKDMHEKFHHRDDFAMVGVAVDESQEDVKAYCERNEIAWTQLHEHGRKEENGLSNLLGVKFAPAVWIIHKNRDTERVTRRSNQVVKALQEKPVIQVNLEDMTVGTELASW